MSLWQTLLEALRAMRMNRLRTGLTMLGIIIGVGAVVLMLAIGESVRGFVGDKIASMGSNLLIVLPGSQTASGLRVGIGSAQTLTTSDAGALGTIENVVAAAPMVSGGFQLAYGNANWSTGVNGVTPDYFTVRGWEVDSGSLFGDLEMRSASRVAVIGKTVAEQLFGPEDPVGRMIRIRNRPFEVIGVLAGKGRSLDGNDQDDVVLVPLNAARQHLVRGPFAGSVRMIFVQAATPGAMADVQEDVSQMLRIRHKIRDGQDDDFTVRDLAAVAETFSSIAGAMSLMLGAIGSISLLVGGIGIMNIMLVSVTERTREIGIRMALGAKRRNVLAQFLAEAVAICVAGGVLGIALAASATWVVSRIAGLEVSVSLPAILLAVGFSAAIGVFFGFYPARKAALMRPVEALRYE